MLSDPIFKAALLLSFVTHFSIVSPWWGIEKEQKAVNADNVIEVSYVIINDPRLARAEEQYTKSAGSETALEEEVRIQKESGEAAQEEIVCNDGSPDEETLLVKENEQRRKEQRAGDKQGQRTFLKYFNLIREKVRTEIHSFTGSTEKGQVTVVFTVEPSGRLQVINSITSDISPAMEQKTISGIKRAQPFPPFPEDMGTVPVRFSLTVRFTS